MDTFLLLVPVVVGAIVLYRALRSRPGEQGSSPVAVEPAAEGPPDLPLAAKLSALDTGISAAAAGIAHPRELYEVTEFKAAIRLLRDEHVDADIVLSYALGGTWTVACAALAALAERPDRAVVMSEIYAAIDNMSVYPMFFALQNVIADPDAGPVGAVLAGARDWWRESPLMVAIFRDHLTRRDELGANASFGSQAQRLTAESQATVTAFLTRLDHPVARSLAAEIVQTPQSSVDHVFLRTIGRFWGEQGVVDSLIIPDFWREGIETALHIVKAKPARSIIVTGEPRVGKTAFLKLLALRLETDGWQVLEAGGADLMAGQQWFGQLEGRIQALVGHLAAEKRLVWYIPDILQLAMSGTHQGQAASILDQIMPAIAAGRLIVWAETSPAAVTRLLRLRPSLRGLFDLVRLEPQSPEETLGIAKTLAQRLTDGDGPKIEPGSIETAIGAAKQYLTAASFPGAGLDLLKLAYGRAAKAGAKSLGPPDVIATLSQLTGLPEAILDTRERVDLGEVRKYFTDRVIGQDEAVAAVVDRIAMLKAGLNDPGKPIGVFLFAGPTGTGKTELAKTLAEYLFGSVDRLVRLDMSEFQSFDSTGKILGAGEAAGGTESLISLVRKQPFSVVLLDEFEKAHANVWDLFLQVFDDGRLTDQLGGLADFRHCFIILTSNLGATAHRSSGLGFSPAQTAFSSDQIMRAVGQTFRPEFQNRLDKVIVFQPLSRELMRGILAKELQRVLERRGLKDREWAIEWEASAIDFLLEKGFSPEMGARPLKRAIEDYVIAPLAATIVEKRFPEGDQFVFVRSDGKRIEAEFVDPDFDASARDAGTPAGEQVGLPQLILSPTGSEAERAVLDRNLASVRTALAAPEWERTKAALTDAMSAADFWTRPERASVLARLALIDRVQAAAGTAVALHGRLARGAVSAGKSSRELAGRLALQLHLVSDGIADVHSEAPIEAALVVEPALEKPGDGGATAAWCSEIAGMYRAWAVARRMQVEEIGDDGRPMLLVTGFGAHRVLAREAGLHVLDRGEDERGAARSSARVRIAVAPLGDLSADAVRAAVRRSFASQPGDATLVRRYRREPSPLVRDMFAGWRSGRIDQVLAGNFDLIGGT